MLVTSMTAVTFAAMAVLWMTLGRVVLKGTIIRRSESPGAFWLCVIFSTMLSLFALVLSLIHPPGIF